MTNFVLLQAFLELVKALLLEESRQPQPSAYSARYITPRTVTTVARRQVVAGFEFPPNNSTTWSGVEGLRRRPPECKVDWVTRFRQGKPYRHATWSKNQVYFRKTVRHIHESGQLVASVDKGHDLRTWRRVDRRTVIALVHGGRVGHDVIR